MNHTTEGRGSRVEVMSGAAREAIWEISDIELGKEDLAAIADRRFIDALDFDCVKASQAREDFIKATIIFFGLDGECPALAGILEA